MSEWRSLTIAEVCSEAGGGIQTGPFGSQLHASDYVDDGTPSVMPQNIGDNRILSDGIARVSDEDMARLERYWLREGDIVYSRRGDVERRALVRAENDGWLCGTGCLRIRIGDQEVHDSRFVAYSLGLEESRRWIVRHAVGATMLNLNTEILGRAPISVPGVHEQRAIAEVLGALDDKIAANDRVIEVADELRSSLVATSPSTVAVEQIAHQCARSLTPDDFAAIVDHYSLPAFDAGARPDRADRDSIKSNKLAVDGPSVLMSKLNPRIPRVWEVPTPSATAVTSTEFVVLAPDGVSTSELWAALRAPAATAALASQVAGTSGSHQRVKPADILALEVADPRVLERGVRALIDALGADVESRRTESQRLATTRNELLPLLMSGKVRVRDAEKRVEEVL